MPSPNHTPLATHAQISAALFPLSSEPAAAAAPLELWQQQMPTLLHLALTTMTHFCGPPERFLAGIDDPRASEKVTYSLPCLLFTGLWMFLCPLGARRQVALNFRDNAPSAAHFAQLFGVAPAPHGDTLNHTCQHLAPAQVQECVTRLVELLLRKKVLARYRRLDQSYVIAVDGTGLYSFAERHCAHCLTRTHKGQTTYYHYVLAAKLVTCEGFSFSLLSEFSENPAADPRQQDCELNAFQRRAARLKERFPRLPRCLSLDGLFACGPVFQRCRDYHWHYVIVLKEDDRKSVYPEFVGRAPLQPEQQLKERRCRPVALERNFRWVNDSEYRDSKGREHLLKVRELHETKRAAAPPKTTRFMWVTELSINSGNVRAVAPQAGRDRWKIEKQGFNSQQQGGFALEHLYRHDYTSAKVFYFLLPMAPLFFQLMVRRNLFKKYFPRGFGALKNCAGRLREAWRNSLLHEPALAC